MSFYNLGFKIAKKYRVDIINSALNLYKTEIGIPLIIAGKDTGNKFKLLLESIRHLELETFYNEILGFADGLYEYIRNHNFDQFYGYSEEAIKTQLSRIPLLDGFFSTIKGDPICCTCFIIRKKIVGGNLDLNKDRARTNLIFRLNKPPKPYFKSFTITLKFLIGSLIGINSKHIGVFYNSLKPINFRNYSDDLIKYENLSNISERRTFIENKAGLPPSLIVQKILDSASQIRKAVKIASKTPCIGSYNFLIFNKKKCVVIEKCVSYEGIKSKKRKSKQFLVSTNHSVKKLFNATKCHDYPDSCQRYNYVFQKLQSLVNYELNSEFIDEIKKILRYHFKKNKLGASDTGVCRHCENITTVLSVIFNLKNKDYYYCCRNPCINDYVKNKL